MFCLYECKNDSDLHGFWHTKKKSYENDFKRKYNKHIMFLMFV